MPGVSSLKAPLLLHTHVTETDAANGKVKYGEEAIPIVLSRSSSEFLADMHGTAMSFSKNGMECEGVHSTIDALAETSEDQALRLVQEWTFASSSSPESTEGWIAMRTDRLDWLLQTWSQMTAHLATPNVNNGGGGGAYVSFFPTCLSSSIPPSTNGCSDSVYYEVRVHIPICPFYEPLSTGDEIGKDASSLSETLEEFARSRRMHVRWLRSLIHDAVLSFISSAFHSSDLSTSWKKRDDEAFCASMGDDVIEGCASYGCSSSGGISSGSGSYSCRRKGSFGAVHQFLPPSLAALALPIPVVFSIGVARDGKGRFNPDDRVGNELSDTQGKGEETTISLDIGTVVQLMGSHVHERHGWTPESIAFEVLASLFPKRFALHAAVSIEVGEVNPSSGVVSEWLEFTSAAVLEAGQRMCAAKVWVPPAPKPLESVMPTPSMNSTTTADASNTVRKQHDPYSVLTWTPTYSETPAMDGRHAESTGETADVSSCITSSHNSSSSVRTQTLEEKNDSPCENLHMPSTDSELTAVVETAAAGVGVEEVLALSDVKQIIVALAKDFAASRARSDELLRALQSPLSLTRLHTAEKHSSSRHKGRPVFSSTGSDAEATCVVYMFLGVPAGEERDERALKHAIAHMAGCGADGVITYAELDGCARNILSMAQALESRLRASALEVMCVRQGRGNAPIGSVTVKAGRKEKGMTSFFVSEVENILRGRSQRKRNDAVETILRYTAPAFAEARRSIDEACEKLRETATRARQHVERLQMVRQMCQDVFVPWAEARIALEKREKNERSRLKLECTVSENFFLERRGVTARDELMVIDAAGAEGAEKCDVRAVISGEEEMLAGAVLRNQGEDAGGQSSDRVMVTHRTAGMTTTLAGSKKSKRKSGVVSNHLHSATTAAEAAAAAVVFSRQQQQQQQLTATTTTTKKMVGDGSVSKGLGGCSGHGKRRHTVKRTWLNSMPAGMVAWWIIFSLVAFLFALCIVIFSLYGEGV